MASVDTHELGLQHDLQRNGQMTFQTIFRIIVKSSG